jgi:hypothetical protein
MSENDTTTGQALTPQPPPRPVKVYTPVENAMGIMDTARFEHLGRVATVLARAGLLPQSITHFKGDNDKMIPLDFETVQARAFLIANQADLFHCDPNALAQCTSFVHGKLMYEGKLVHGIISARLGVNLLYEFGRWDPQTRNIKGKYEGEGDDREWVGEMPPAEDQALAVRVSGVLPGERRPRWIAGSVGMWHKGAKSPWGASTAWPRQLRYMGAREWCRAYAPSLLLGIITDDEMDDYRMALEAGVAAPAIAPPVHGGFEERGRAQLLAAPTPSTDEAQESVQRKRAARRKAAEETAPPLTEARVADPQACEHEWKSEGAVHTCKKCGLIDDAGEADPPRPTETGSAPAADPEPDTSETATPASEDGQPEEGGSGPSPQPEEPTPEDEGQADTHDAEIIEDGHAAPGETYLMEGDQPNAEGRRLTYRDGVRCSTTKGNAEFKVYGEHAPEVVDAEAQEEEEGEVFGADLPQEVRIRVEAYMQAVESFGPAGTVTEDVNGVPTKREPFDRVKLELQALRADGTWAALGGDAYQNEVRRDTWHIMADTFFPGDLPDYRTSPSAWRLWVEAEDDPEKVEESIGQLEDSEAFKKMDNAMKEQLRAAGYARINAINEGE